MIKRITLYLITEAMLSLCFSLFFVVCSVVMEYPYWVILISLISSLWLIDKFVLGIKLIIDILEGPTEADTKFMGILQYEKLEFFYKINYAQIYFDDSVLTKNYLLFDTTYLEILRPDDKIVVKFYKRSRIVLRMYKMS